VKREGREKRGKEQKDTEIERGKERGNKRRVNIIENIC